MKNLLFPHSFRLIGWILFIPTLLLGMLTILGIVGPPVLGPVGAAEIIMDDLIVIGIAVGALFIVCSRERVEDELTKEIRLLSLLYSVYAYVGLLVVCTILINGVDFLLFALVNMALFPVIFAVSFRIMMSRNKMLNADEEQD